MPSLRCRGTTPRQRPSQPYSQKKAERNRNDEEITSTFDDTPEWKRRRRWDPATGDWARQPPTARQLALLRDLCVQAAVDYAPPADRLEARARIDALMRTLKRRGGTAAVSGAEQHERGGDVSTPMDDAPPSREVVARFFDERGYEYIGPSLHEDDPDYEPPPPDGTWEIAALRWGSRVGLYRVRRKDLEDGRATE
jgi:hypothetical protein